MGAQLAIDFENPGAQPSDEAIRQRSQEIWENEGRPEGRSEEHWARARAELAELLARTANANIEPRPDITEPVAVEPETAAVAEPAESIAPSESEEEVLEVEPDRECVAHQDASCVVDDPASTAADEPALFEAAAPIPAALVPAAPRPLHLPPVKRAGNAAVMPSIISAGLEFHGTLQSPGDIQFAGFIEGTLRGDTLFVDEDAVVEGDVIGDDVIVRGRVNGRICARKLVLRAGCHVEGDILYGSLVVENGAGLEARFAPLCEEPAEDEPAQDEVACQQPM